MMDQQLRPIELTVRRLRSEGLSHAEVAWRLRRSPGYVRRVEAMSEMGPRSPRRADQTGSAAQRPIERCVLKLLDEGSSYAEVASRFRRTPEFVARVEHFAGLRAS